MDKSQKHDGIKQPDAKENIVSFRIDKTNLWWLKKKKE